MPEGKHLKPVKEKEGGEDDDYNALIDAPKAKPASKEEPIDALEEEDNVPLAFSKVQKKKKSGNPSKVKKEDLGRESDHRSPKGKMVKKEAAISNGELSEVKKEVPQDEKTDKARILKKEVTTSNGKPLKVKREEKQDSEEEERSDKGKKQKKEAAKSNGKPSRIKKEETQDSEEEEEKAEKGKIKKKAVRKSNGKLSNVKKEEEEKDKKKKKKKKEMEKVVGMTSKDAAVQGKGKKEKKVYNLPGQKHDPPEERDPLRMFYETLYQQVPTSEMAAFWMLEWGLLPPEEAEEVYEKKMRKSQQQKLGSPVKAVSVKKTATVTIKKMKIASETTSKLLKKRKASDSDDGDDFVLSKKIKKAVSR